MRCGQSLGKKGDKAKDLKTSSSAETLKSLGQKTQRENIASLSISSHNVDLYFLSGLYINIHSLNVALTLKISASTKLITRIIRDFLEPLIQKCHLEPFMYVNSFQTLFIFHKNNSKDISIF